MDTQYYTTTTSPVLTFEEYYDIPSEHITGQRTPFSQRARTLVEVDLKLIYRAIRESSVSQAPILLKGFRRIFLKKGESKQVTFTLGKEELSLYNMEMKQVVEPGEFKVMVGTASNDIRLDGEFTLTP